jgi:hypothetical protein
MVDLSWWRLPEGGEVFDTQLYGILFNSDERL